MWNGNEQIALLPGVLVLHCTALYDGVSKNGSGALGLSDKHSAIEATRAGLTTRPNWRTSRRRAQGQDATSSGFVRRDCWRITMILGCEVRSTCSKCPVTFLHLKNEPDAVHRQPALSTSAFVEHSFCLAPDVLQNRRAPESSSNVKLGLAVLAVRNPKSIPKYNINRMNITTLHQTDSKLKCRSLSCATKFDYDSGPSILGTVGSS